VQSAIRIRHDALSKLIEQAEPHYQEECCGLLAGSNGVIAHAFPAKNVATDTAKSYEIAPEELFRLMREIRGAGLELMGIYHSHPNGKNEPSPRDIECAYYPDVAYFILSPRAAVPVRAFSIRDGRSEELEITAE
jgi:proteasome lid subunit RPN8/RPN11